MDIKYPPGMKWPKAKVSYPKSRVLAYNNYLGLIGDGERFPPWAPGYKEPYPDQMATTHIKGAHAAEEWAFVALMEGEIGSGQGSRLINTGCWHLLPRSTPAGHDAVVDI